MTNEPRPPDPPEIAKPVVQFSLRSAFVVMTLAAVGCALVFQIPDIVAIPLVLFVTVALVPVLVTVMIYGSSYQRTFRIGPIFPPGLLLVAFSPIARLLDGVSPAWGAGESLWFRVIIGGFWIASAVMGLLCLATRRLVENRPDTNATRSGTPFAQPWNAGRGKPKAES